MGLLTLSTAGCRAHPAVKPGTVAKNHRGEWAPNPGTDRTGSEFPAKCAGNPCQSCQSRGRSWVAMKSAWQFFMNFRGPKAHPNRVEKPPRTSGNLLRLPAFFMKFRGPKAHPNRGEKPPRTSGNLLRLTAFFMKFRGRNAHPNRGEKPPRGVGSEPRD